MPGRARDEGENATWRRVKRWAGWNRVPTQPKRDTQKKWTRRSEGVSWIKEWCWSCICANVS